MSLGRAYRPGQQGYVSALALLLLSLFVAAGIALLDNQAALNGDAAQSNDRARAKFLAESAVQKGKYYLMYVHPEFSGAGPVETISASTDGAVEAYFYEINRTGPTVTIVGTGSVTRSAGTKNRIVDVRALSYVPPLGRVEARGKVTDRAPSAESFEAKPN